MNGKIEVDGKIIDVEVILTFSKNNNNYIVYTDHVLDEYKEERVLASKYNLNKGIYVLLGELNESDLKVVEKEMEKLING